MAENKLKEQVVIIAEELPDTEESRTEAIRKAAALAAEDAQRAIQEIKERSEALKREILLHARIELSNEESS